MRVVALEETVDSTHYASVLLGVSKDPSKPRPKRTPWSSDHTGLSYLLDPLMASLEFVLQDSSKTGVPVPKHSLATFPFVSVRFLRNWIEFCPGTNDNTLCPCLGETTKTRSRFIQKEGKPGEIEVSEEVALCKSKTRPWMPDEKQLQASAKPRNTSRVCSATLCKSTHNSASVNCRGRDF